MYEKINEPLSIRGLNLKTESICAYNDGTFRRGDFGAAGE